MKKYIGNYLGIVVQNDDPVKRGRIKVFVPHVSATIYNDWNNDKKDKEFIFPDNTTNPDLIKILEPVKEILPWAECASPLFGGDSPARYNAYTQKGTTSDSNYWEGNEFIDGNRPIQNFVGDNVYDDPFSSTGENGNRFVNEYSYEYTPSNYSNLARGMFTIPNVGSHVWVFFAEGSPNLPVYFAASHGGEDWRRIYSMDQKTEEFSSVDYPATYENKNKNETTLNDDVKRFRAKTVFNSNKHSLEFVDTDEREILKMTHFSGSFKEFTNYANIELASNNDQKMVIGDQFYSVRKNQSIYVGNTQEIIVNDDRYKTIGPSDTQSKCEEILDILKEIHEYKRLFEGQRADDAAPSEVSKYQKRAGIYAFCPVCNNIPYESNIENWIIAQPAYGLIPPVIPLDVLNLGDFQDIIDSSPIGWHLGSRCDVCNNLALDNPFPGFSPSTQDGTWLPEPRKLPGGPLDQLLLKSSDELAKLQRELGEGDEITKISKNKIETIGVVMNDMKSFRVDPIGKLRIDGVNVALEGMYPTFRTSPHVEYVDVDDVPGGDYNLTCTNKYKLLVGAKGINIKTFGPMDMYGTIVNLIGEQVNISSQNEVLIDGGERFSIRARKISLIPIEHQPVVIDGQLHVTRNVVVAGGMMMEGEFGVQHITAPYEFQLTEYNTPLPGVNTGGPIPFGGSHVHEIRPHIHAFKSIPTTFLPAKEGVRDTMRINGVNSNVTIVASTDLFINSVAPEEVTDAANSAAKSFNSTAVFSKSQAISSSGDVTVYEFTYDVNYPEKGGKLRPLGLKVVISYDTVSEDVGSPSSSYTFSR